MIPADIVKRLHAAFECSIYLAPTDPGLTYEEIHEVAKRANLLLGETDDALKHLHVLSAGPGSLKILPDAQGFHLDIFQLPKNPDYRNFAALDFICQELNQVIRSEGGQSAQLSHEVLVQRAIAKNIPELDIEAAIVCFTLTSSFVFEKDGYLRSRSGSVFTQLPSQQRPMQSQRPLRG